MTSPFWKAHEKLSWVAKVKLYLASAVFELLLLIWAKAQIIPLTQKTVFLLLLLLFFYEFFAGLFLLQFSIYRHENSQECWYYCHLGCYDFLWRWIWYNLSYFKKTRFYKKTQTLRQYLLFFKSFFFILFHVSKAKPMVDIRHDLSLTVFKLEAIENDDFRENVKYLIS